jgi:hypothetical protein
LRDEYRERFGGGWEERFRADAGTPLGEAKRALHDWLAEIEARIKAIRDAAAGKGRSLTHRQTLALAGEVKETCACGHVLRQQFGILAKLEEPLRAQGSAMAPVTPSRGHPVFRLPL